MNAAPSLDAFGSEKIRAKVARYFYSHPYFQAPTDRPKSIAGLLKKLEGRQPSTLSSAGAVRTAARSLKHVSRK
jgi:hypothetical protein